MLQNARRGKNGKDLTLSGMDDHDELSDLLRVQEILPMTSMWPVVQICRSNPQFWSQKQETLGLRFLGLEQPTSLYLDENWARSPSLGNLVVGWRIWANRTPLSHALGLERHGGTQGPLPIGAAT